MITLSSGLPVQPGDFAAVRTHGPVSDGISIAEKLSGGTGKWQHAMFYAGGPSDLILEAEPGGARLHSFWDNYRGREEDLLWSTTNPKLDLLPSQRALAMPLAKQFEGTPYSDLDYLAIAEHRAHVPGWLPFWFGQDHHLVTLRTYIGETGHQICSQIVDYLRFLMSSYLFADHRWFGYVAPDDIGAVIAGLAS